MNLDKLYLTKKGKLKRTENLLRKTTCPFEHWLICKS